MSFTPLVGIYYILGAIGLISALIVVSARNPIHRIASLVVVFMVGAFIFMLLDYYFLGLTYIIVYVGAIAILFLFVIMMVQIPIVPSGSLTTYTPLILMPFSYVTKEQSLSGPSSAIGPTGHSDILMADMGGNHKGTLEDSTDTGHSMPYIYRLCIPSQNLALGTLSAQNKKINSLGPSLIDIILEPSSIISPTSASGAPLGVLNNMQVGKKDAVKYETNLNASFFSINALTPSLIRIGIYSLLCLCFLIIIYLLHTSSLFSSFNLSTFLFNEGSIVSGSLLPYSHFYPIWSIEYKTMTDIESLGYIVYIAFPTALILISITLWSVLIGIISICSPKVSSLHPILSCLLPVG